MISRLARYGRKYNDAGKYNIRLAIYANE